MSSALPATNSPSAVAATATATENASLPADATTTTTIQDVFALVAAGEHRDAGAMYADLLGTDPDDFEDDEETTPKFPVPEMTVGERVLWDQGFASRIAVEPWQAAGSEGLAGILQQGLFEANLARARARPAPSLGTVQYRGKNADGQRFVCYVRGCNFSSPFARNMGRFSSHWHRHPELGETDPEPGRRWKTDAWRWIRDQNENGGWAAKRAETEEEFLSFFEQALQQKQWDEEDRQKAQG